MAKPQPTDAVFVAVHPAEAEIEAFFAGTLHSPIRLRVFRHLLAGCAECAALCRPVLAGHALAFAPIPSKDDYDAPIDQAFARLREQVGSWGALVGLPSAANAPESGAATHPPDLEDSLWVKLAWVDRLVRVARSMRGGSLADYTQFATEALDAALALAEREPNETLLWDLAARSRAERANAWRLAGSTQAAIAELEAARQEAGKGSEGLPLLVEIASLEASAFMDGRQLGQAEILLAQLETFHRATGDYEALGRTLMQIGNVAYFQGAYTRAATAYVVAHDNLIIAKQNEVAGFAFKNAVDALVRAGLYAEAGQLLPDLRRCLEPHASPIEIRKLRWMEAKCVAGVGCVVPAAAELWRLAGEFGAMGLPYHQALVVLDLCGIWLYQGLYAEIADASGHLVRTFGELGIEREALQAIFLLKQAAVQQRVTDKHLAAAIRQVEGLQTRPARC
ncbi:MAG: hypothetical protein ABJC13_21115 [Acidobacteriota bacterium]